MNKYLFFVLLLIVSINVSSNTKCYLSSDDDTIYEKVEQQPYHRVRGGHPMHGTGTGLSLCLLVVRHCRHLPRGLRRAVVGKARDRLLDSLCGASIWQSQAYEL